MALNSEITVNAGMDGLPDGYTIPAITVTLGDAGGIHRTTGTHTLPTTTMVDADPATGLGNVVADTKTFVDTMYLPGSAGVDIVGLSVDAVITIHSIKRVHGGSIFKNVDNFEVEFEVKWEAV